jgi:hypothetical protein
MPVDNIQPAPFAAAARVAPRFLVLSTTTTLARVIEGYRRHPEDAAWAVILHVNRRGSSVPLAT